MTSDELRAKARLVERPDGFYAAVPLADAQAALAECEAKLQQFAADTVEGFDCLPTCDSTAHDELCPVAHPVEAWRVLRARLAECERKLNKTIADWERTRADDLAERNDTVAELRGKLAECEQERDKLLAFAKGMCEPD